VSEDGIAETDEFIEQIVFEHRPGKGVVPVRFTMPEEDLDRYVSGLYLARHVAASSELPNGGNLFYRQFGPDDRWAMLAYRESAPLQRLTSRAHVLIASSNALTPLAAVAMWDWPWPMEAVGGELPTLTNRAFAHKVDETSGLWQGTLTNETYRLLIELVCHDKELAVKARPGLRKDLLIAVAQQAPASLHAGFSVHETRYDQAQKSLPRLCFISEEQERSGYETRRRMVDLDTAESGPGPVSDVAQNLAAIYREGGRDEVAAVLDRRLHGYEETIRELLTRWGVPTSLREFLQAESVQPLADDEMSVSSDSHDAVVQDEEKSVQQSIDVRVEAVQELTDAPQMPLDSVKPGLLAATVLPPDAEQIHTAPPAQEPPVTDTKAGSGKPSGHVETGHEDRQLHAPVQGAQGVRPHLGPNVLPDGQPAPDGSRQDGNLYLVTYVEVMVVVMLVAVAILLLSGSR
jgi:hypothetical protein